MLREKEVDFVSFRGVLNLFMVGRFLSNLVVWREDDISRRGPGCRENVEEVSRGVEEDQDVEEDMSRRCRGGVEGCLGMSRCVSRA